MACSMVIPMMQWIGDNWLVLVTFIASAFSILMQVRKERATAQKMEEEAKKISGADTAKTYMEVANLAGEQYRDLLKRIEEMESRIAELESINSAKDGEIQSLKKDVAEKTNRIRILENLVANREGLIAELEDLVHGYERRIQELEMEVERLKKTEL